MQATSSLGRQRWTWQTLSRWASASLSFRHSPFASRHSPLTHTHACAQISREVGELQRTAREAKAAISTDAVPLRPPELSDPPRGTPLHPLFDRLLSEPEDADELLGSEREPPMVLPIELSLVCDTTPS